MGQFTTENLLVRANTIGFYDVDNTGDVDVIVNVKGDWRSGWAGDGNGERLFNAAEIRRIRTLRSTNTLRTLSEMFDCSHIMIRQICLRAAYADVV